MAGSYQTSSTRLARTVPELVCPYPADQRARMDRVEGRWLNEESLKEEFPVLELCYPSFSVYSRQLTPKNIPVIVESMKQWIEGRNYRR